MKLIYYFYLAGESWAPNIWASRATDEELERSGVDSTEVTEGGRGGRPGKSVGGLVTREDWW